MKLTLKKKVADVVPPSLTKTTFTAIPSDLAVCIALAGGNRSAGMLLYNINGLWRVRKKKLVRQGREWLAMSTENWSKSAGPSFYQIRDKAIPALKKHCSAFLTIRAMKVAFDKPKEIWMSLDAAAFEAAKASLKE